jgi:hypothetical protein
MTLKKLLVLSFVLLASAAWLQAQYATSQAPGAAAPSQVEGCLQSVRGHYVVADKGGTNVELSGAANKLGKLVGHNVQISGTSGAKTSDTTAQGSASSAGETPVLRVKTVKDMGKGCE